MTGDLTSKKITHWTVEQDVLLHAADRKSQLMKCKLADCLTEVTKGHFDIGGGVLKSLNALYKRRRCLLTEYPSYIDPATVYKIQSMVDAIPEDEKYGLEHWSPIASYLRMTIREAFAYYRQCHFWFLLHKEHRCLISGWCLSYLFCKS